MTILKALKDRIRSMGGETNATNIADAIKDLPKGGSSELPPEVSNAVETHGMGWTDEDETVHQIDEKYIPSSGGALDTIKLTASLDEGETIVTLVTPESDVIANINNIKFAEIDGSLYGFVMNRQMGVTQEGTYLLVFSGVHFQDAPVHSVVADSLSVVITFGEGTTCDLNSIEVYSEPEETD